MAIRTISVKVSANVAQYVSAMNKAATATKQLNTATNASRGVGKQAQNLNQVGNAAKGAGKNLGNFNRSMGSTMARTANTSAVAHRAGAAFKVMSTNTGVAAKAMGMLRLAVTATLSAFAGFIFINAAIQTVQKFFSVTIGGFTEFNKAMTETMAIIPDATGEIEKGFTESAQAIAKVTKFSPDEVAEGFYFLASAGYTSAQAMQSMEQVARFAQAGVMDLAEASEIAADTVAALGLADKFDPKGTADAIERVTDVMVGAAKQANATVKQFGDAFTNKFANMLSITNKSVEEGAAVLGAFANQGIKGQVAGTRASMALRDLQRASIKNSAAFQSMNIAVYDSQGNMRNMADIIFDMENALGGLSDQQKKSALTTLGFQDRSVQALLAIIGSSDAIRRMEKDLKSAGGTVDEVSEKQMKSLSNRMNQAVSIMKSFSVEFGNSVAEKVEVFVKKMTPAWNSMFAGVKSVIKVLGDFITPFKFLIGGATLGAIVALSKAFELFGSLVQKFSGAFAGLGLIMLARWLPLQGMFSSIGASAVGAFTAIKTAITGTTFDAMKFKVALSAGVSEANAKILATSVSVQTLGQRLKGAAIGGNTLKLSIASIGTSGAMAALMAIPMALQLFADEARKAGAAVDEYMGQFDTETLAGMEAAHASLFKELASGQESLKETGGGWEETWQNINPFIDNDITQLEEQQKKRLEVMEQNKRAHAQQKKAILEVQKTVHVSGDVIEATAKRNGINLATEGSQWTEAVATIKGALEEEVSGLDQVALAQGDLADMTDDQLGEVKSSYEDMAEKAMDVLSELYGPGAALESAVERSNLIFGSLFTPSEVYSNLTTEAEEQAQSSAEAQVDAFNSALDGRVDALKDAKEAQGKVHDDMIEDAKKREKDGLKEVKEASQDQFDDRLDALKEQKKEQEDFYNEPIIGLDTLFNGLRKAADQSTAFNEKMSLLGESGASTALLNMFRDMGEEALPMLDDLLIQGQEKIRSFNGLADQLGEPPEVDLEVFKRELLGKTEEGIQFRKDAFEIQGNINLERFELPEGTTSNSLLKQLIGMGPEGEALIADMANKIRTGGEAGVAEAEELLNQVYWTNDFMGILTAMGQTMDATEFVFGMSIQSIKDMSDQARMGIIDDNVRMMADIQREFGLDEINGIDFVGLEAKAKYAGSDKVMDGRRQEAEARAAQGRKNSEAAGVSGKTGTGGRIDSMPSYTSPWQEYAGSGWMPPGLSKGQKYLDLRLNKLQRVAGEYADGGFHNAQIARGGGSRIWNEPETGGEAYIPLSPSKRGRSEHILETVASEFGYGLMRYANGGMNGPAGYSMVGAGRYGTGVGQQAPTVVVPVSKNEVTQFNGPIQGVSMEGAMAFAKRKKRQKNLTA